MGRTGAEFVCTFVRRGDKRKTKKMIEQNKTKKEMGNFSIDRPGIYLDGRTRERTDGPNRLDG